jgi:hypothetical protein
VPFGFEEGQVLFAELVGLHWGGWRSEVGGQGVDPEYNRGVRVGAGRECLARPVLQAKRIGIANCLQA